MIPYLQVEGLTRYWGEQVLFEDLNFTIAQGQKVALIARNGAGKTTLFNTLTGSDLPDSGKITFSNHITVGYLRQNPARNDHLTVMEEVYQSTSEMVQAIRDYEAAIEGTVNLDLQKCTERMDRLNAWDFEVKIKQILTQLKITRLDQRMGELSGGQQKRVALANVLINEPDLLLLDEPTNHLDLDMIEWLEEFLGKMKSTLFMVTHDRYFLDRVCNEILELDNNTLYRYRGNYTYFLEKRADRQDQLRSEVEKARNLMRTEQEWMRRMPKARATKAKYRIDSFAELKAKATQSLSEEELALNIQASRLGNKVINIEHVSKSYDSLKVISKFSYKFSRFEKVGIVGENGSGKTTLLNLLTGILKPDSGKVDIGETVKFGYYRQDGIQFSPDDKVLDVVQEIADFIDLGKGRQWNASQLLTHFMFPYEAQHAKVEKLSGGEKRRLYLCTVLMQNPNFLILDEPTNDLDIMTLNVLENYLQGFNGCVLIVSHDRFFMDKIVDHVFAFEENGTIRDFPGNYSLYRDFKDEKERSEKQLQMLDKKENTPEKTKIRNTNKLTFNEKNEFEQLANELKMLETEKEALEAAMSSGLLDHEVLLEKSERYNAIKELLDEKEMRWLELSEKE
ncbi:MAG: ABC-F family ATP-binding cassette domain-containing protein [Prolixibacteraceae bacterium]|nr:ABC-F family ATP-binding cassette domain-containing protein [Prolixibacteraceae bacterium]